MPSRVIWGATSGVVAMVAAFALIASGCGDTAVDAPATTTQPRGIDGAFWSESYAERRVVAKVAVPCGRIHPVTKKDRTCDRKMAKRAAAVRAALDKEIRAAKEGSWEQVQLMQEESMMNHSNDPHDLPPFKPSPLLLQYGYSLASADCIGSGAADRSGDKFSRFRCTARLKSYRPDSLGAPESAPVRVAIAVTGPTTLRWTIQK